MKWTDERYERMLKAARSDSDAEYGRLVQAARRAFPNLAEPRALEAYLRSPEGKAAYEAYSKAPPAPDEPMKKAQGAEAETLADLAMAALEARAAAEYPKLSKAAALDAFLQQPEGKSVYALMDHPQAHQPAPAALLSIAKGRGVSVAVVLEALRKTLAG